MAPPSAPFAATGSTLFATSIILSLVSSFVSRTKGSRLLSSSLASATSGQTLITPTNIPSGEKTVSYWEKFDGEHSFLEDVGGDSALSWVKARNAHATDTLGKPESSPLYTKVLTILNSKDKIPNVSKIGDYYYNFWQDETNQKGLLRRTSPESYRSAKPDWESVLDLDILAKAEGESWVYKGYTLYSPDDKKDPMAYRRILLELSKGGADAVVIREFDLSTKKFISSEDNGFLLPEAKSGVTWKNENVLIVGTDMKNTDGSDTVTASGYPRVVYEWTRGTSLSTAKKVYEGEKSDVSVGGYVSKHRGYVVEIMYRSLTFYTNKKVVRVVGYPSARESEKEWVELPVPLDMQVGMFADQTLLKLRSDWSIGDKETARLIPAGSLLSVSLVDLLERGTNADFTVLFTPSARISLSSYTKTKNILVLNTLENVKSRLHFWTYGSEKEEPMKDTWQYNGGEKEAAIKSTSLSAIDSDDSDDYWLTTSSFTKPSSLFMGNALKGPSGVLSAQQSAVKALPPQFSTDGLVEAQFEATSKDGTKVPYFIVYKDTEGKGCPTGGVTPTLLYGYGGFEISLTPSYAALVGAGWLEKGGCYVSANIRGGGEFGPHWHQAAKKQNRQLAYDDFIAVAEDLIARGITAPKHLGVRGGSNGGMLVGNMYVQRPDLFGAVCCAVPLLDMRRYHKLLAGNSWMAEYGDPDSEDWKFLQAYSPYHNISPSPTSDSTDPRKHSYPPLLMTTSTRDDRVHPYHARCFVKRCLDVQQQGAIGDENAAHDISSKEFKRGSVYYYENLEGGHGGAADNRQQAFMNTLYLEFLWNTIGRK